MGWLSYRNNRRAIDEKIVEELTSLTSHASREFELWLKERRYEMRVLSNSYEVSENLANLNRSGQLDRSKATALRHLQDYLASVGDRFSDYEELVVLDKGGKVLASSRASSGALGPRGDWGDRAWANETELGEVDWVETVDAVAIVIGEPIRAADGASLGTMAAKVSLDEIDGILADFAKDPSHELYMVTENGRILISSRDLGEQFMTARLDAAALDRLFRQESIPVELRSFRGTAVLGALRALPNVGWGMVAEKDRATAYAAITRLRNVTLILISILLFVIGLDAYLLGRSIVGPLNRLTEGSAKVAAGDLEVNLPIHGRGEVGYLTAVFNKMVSRLRTFRDENLAMNQKLRERNNELRTLSITDSLTGLYNRTELSELLEKELARSKRHEHSFSVLMIDIDHFKRYNDTHGHQAGDHLLNRVAQVLKGSLRACDIAARYGGEEFLILLTETGPKGALCLAKKLCGEVEEMRNLGVEAVTVSIGVAAFPENGDETETVIRHADEALYKCKRAGRNQVALARAA